MGPSWKDWSTRFRCTHCGHGVVVYVWGGWRDKQGDEYAITWKSQLLVNTHTKLGPKGIIRSEGCQGITYKCPLLPGFSIEGWSIQPKRRLGLITMLQCQGRKVCNDTDSGSIWYVCISTAPHIPVKLKQSKWSPSSSGWNMVLEWLRHTNVVEIARSGRLLHIVHPHSIRAIPSSFSSTCSLGRRLMNHQPRTGISISQSARHCVLTSCLFALVMATFNRLYSPRKPTSPDVFDLTRLKMIAYYQFPTFDWNKDWPLFPALGDHLHYQ